MFRNVCFFIVGFIFVSFHFGNAQTATPIDKPVEKLEFEETVEDGPNLKILANSVPNKKRIRRHLSLIAGVKHDEEILIPEIPLSIKGNTDLIEIYRIKGTDTFRILPRKETTNGILTIHNKKTGQLLVELRVDVRAQGIEKTLREVQALLADIEGIEYKIVNNKILLDGFVLLPKDIKRISNVIAQFGTDVTSLVNLSPLAKRKIVEYIARDINNPEVTVTSIGDFIKLEGFVNSDAEKERINNIVLLYLPDIVTENLQGTITNVKIADRKPQADIGAYVINLIQVRKAEDKEEPPPKMIQIVIHVVEYAERYLKNFSFQFSPSLRSLGEAQTQGQANAPGSISELAAIVDNLLPKLNWARTHGYAKLLDTASILVQDRGNSPTPIRGSLNRVIVVNNGVTDIRQGQQQPNSNTQSYNVSLNVEPRIKSARSELVEMALGVSTTSGGSLSLSSPRTDVNTVVSVRSRQSAAIAGIISKKSENQFGGPTGAGAVFTLNHGKSYLKGTSNYVLFVTPIVKSSASAGVEQVKKKFRFKE